MMRSTDKTEETPMGRFDLLPGEVPFGAEDATLDGAAGNGGYGANSHAATARADAPDTHGGGPATTHAASGQGATDRQRAFIVKLCDAVGEAPDPAWFRSVAAASAAIDVLVVRQRRVAPTANVQLEGASPKQTAFLTKLAGERGVPVKADWLASKGAASQAIDRLLAQPKAPAEASSPEAAPPAHLQKGAVHQLDGRLIRVHISQRTDRPYAAIAHVLEAAVWDVDEDGVRTLVEPGVVEWEYAPTLTGRLTAETVAPADVTGAFGLLAGRCIYCSHKIDTPESTAVGYGPVCAGKYGLPWGGPATAPTPPPAG
jgi:hypothetical protein